jgi:hypothetical protein
MNCAPAKNSTSRSASVRPLPRIVVACPNQVVVYVIQVPDFGARFWVYQVVDDRTDSYNGTKRTSRD